MINLQPKYIQIVKAILAQYVPEAKVYVFGSRVSLTAKLHSDLDLVIMNQKATPVKRLYLLQDAFAESDLPFRVDVLDWHTISKDFRRQIAEGMEALE
jgi:predicted nucleotidyltransferase